MSPVDICNIALTLIGDRRISRLDEDAQLSDPLAQYCATFYDMARRQVLAAQRWSFAKKAAALSLRAGATTIGFTYCHVLPNDCVRVMELHKAAGTVDSQTIYDGKIDCFKIVGREVWTNYSDIAAFYVFDNESPSTWTPHFVAAVAQLLAHYLAGVVSDNPSASARHLETYERVSLPNAQFYDAVQDESNENERDNRNDSRTLKARYSGNYPYDNEDY